MLPILLGRRHGASLFSAVALRSAIRRVIDGRRCYDELLGASGALEMDGRRFRVIGLGEVAASSGGGVPKIWPASPTPRQRAVGALR